MNNDFVLDFFFILTTLYLIFIKYGIPTLLIFIAYKVKDISKILSFLFVIFALVRLFI